MTGWLHDLRLDDIGGRLALFIDGRNIAGRRQGLRRELDPRSHGDFLDLHVELARLFDLRPPEAAAPLTRPPDAAVRPVLTEALSDRILYG